jgi:hypothetical protein
VRKHRGSDVSASNTRHGQQQLNKKNRNAIKQLNHCEYEVLARRAIARPEPPTNQKEKRWR